MTAEHDGADGAAHEGLDAPTAVHEGLDALMAVIIGEPLPADARRDPAMFAEHRAAEADVALLKEQLARLAEQLTGETRTPAEAFTGQARTPAEAPGSEAPAPSARPRNRPRDRGRPAGTPRPGRPGGRRRGLRIALGSVAGIAALSLVAGLGWLVTRSPGVSADSAGAKSAARAPDKVSGDDGRPTDPELELACSQLVVEGTVARVEPQKQSPWSRITLTVIRSYMPAHGPSRVGFLLDTGAKPAPRTGQHVLVRVGQGQLGASLWAVGEARVAAGRAWIEKALPASWHVTCPSDHSP